MQKNEENPRKSRVLRPAFFTTGTLGGTIQNRTGDGDFADRCLTAWLWCRIQLIYCIHRIHGICISTDQASLFRNSVSCYTLKWV